MSNDYLFDLFTIHIVRGIGCVTFLLNVLACFVILEHSPCSMRGYKRILLGITLTAATADALITLLVVPVPLEGGLGNELVGPLAVFAPNWGNIFALILVWAITSLLWSVEIGFAYRLYVINSCTNESCAGSLINVLLFGHPSLFIIIISIMYSRAFSPEEDKWHYVADHALNVSGKSALMLILPHKYHEHTQFSICFLIYCFIIFVTIVLIVRRIKKILSENSRRMAESSIRLHKMLLRSLIWQTVIPFIFIFIPVVLLILSVTSQNIFIEGAETPYYARLFPAIALCVFSFYSVAHIIVMMTFTKPYRVFIYMTVCQRIYGKTFAKPFTQSLFALGKDEFIVVNHRSAT